MVSTAAGPINATGLRMFVFMGRFVACLDVDAKRA
jgi:hypothetical protein